ncbi:hypothetical protein JNO63_05755 [Anaerococcus sp. mt242]|uniref:hypothetical protein n=1 Tax=Anaerococcus sp. mt242 TaxID=2661917 RepID=UPI0019348446|nr:hypothetical protein [Anaerococcus sp. mt242]MBM0046594.1 hypothetical protein [Anaerococcus sp. mt242]
MRDTVKLFSLITGFFRTLVTIIFLLGIGFTILVDTNLLMSILDLVGFQGLSAGIVKPVFIIILALLFVVNFIITRHIYKAGDTGEYHLSNFVFALLFLAITAFVYITFRSLTTNLIFVFFALNGLLVLNSLLGLIAKTRGLYQAENTNSNNITNPNNYIEFEDEKVEKISTDSKAIGLNDVVGNTGEIKVIKTDQANKEEQSQASTKTKSNNKNKTKTQSINKNKEEKAPESDTKMVFESDDNNENTIKNSKPLADKKQATNKISYENIDKNGEIYGEDEANKIKKEKDSKVFDKNQFTEIKVDDIKKENK